MAPLSAGLSRPETHAPVTYSGVREERDAEIFSVGPADADGLDDDTAGASAAPLRSGASWLVLGLCNNAAYVIMMACAKKISEGGTALVFIANIVPSLAIKITSPYWFDRVSYRKRMGAASLLMVVSFVVVALGSSVYMQLLGVALASGQCGLGEASLLALAGKCDGSAAEATSTTAEEEEPQAYRSPDDARQGRGGNGEHSRHDHEQVYEERFEDELNTNDKDSKGTSLTCFSSGTGLAGVFGYLWKFVWNDWLDFSLSVTLIAAISIAIVYWGCYRSLEKSFKGDFEDKEGQVNMDPTPLDDPSLRPNRTEVEAELAELQALQPTSTDASRVIPIHLMTTGQRFVLVLKLWPYMIPLFVVYAAEYALQAGTWTSIGFPLTSVKSRDRFYGYSNWLYQAGVFVSRSSGTLFTAPMWALWLMPVLQTVNLGFVSHVAVDAHSVWYKPSVLYSTAFYAGLLGGSVYIQGYIRICKDLPLPHREFALAATSTAEGVGVLVADVLGLFIQSCLYQVHGLEGAIVSCPVR